MPGTEARFTYLCGGGVLDELLKSLSKGNMSYETWEARVYFFYGNVCTGTMDDERCIARTQHFSNKTSPNFSTTFISRHFGIPLFYLQADGVTGRKLLFSSWLFFFGYLDSSHQQRWGEKGRGSEKIPAAALGRLFTRGLLLTVTLSCDYVY
jgi:hypothetical protein